MFTNKRWIKTNDNRDNDFVEKSILTNFGVEKATDLNIWFEKSYSNKYFIKGLKEAVAFARKFKDLKVTIVGDYDADGTTATAILYLGLKEYGFTNVNYRIPRRFSEGFGINTNIIDEISDGLIITCDNGIAAIDAIKKAKDKGLAVIITDHHKPVVIDEQEILPPADYIIDPNAISDSADFSGYCGAGIAYKFICELFGFDKKIRYKYLSLAAIGTVADVMDLREENYVFVRNALKIIDNPFYTSVGLQALIKVLKLGGENKIKASDISFGIGPTINSASRLNDTGAESVIELLIFNGNMEKAIEMANVLLEINQCRKEQEKETMKTINEIIVEYHLENSCPITIFVPNINEGIIGILAGNISEKFNVPTLIFTNAIKDGQEYFKGSARSPEGFDLKELFDRHSHLFLKYGGHASAAGMSINKDVFDKLVTELLTDDIVKAFYQNKENYTPVNYYYEISVEDVSKIIHLLEKYAPFGKGNPEPMFSLKFEPTMKYGTYRKKLGKSNTTLKLYGKHIDAITFSLAEQLKDIPEKTNLQIIGTLNSSCFRGTTQIQIEIKDCEEVV